MNSPPFISRATCTTVRVYKLHKQRATYQSPRQASRRRSNSPKAHLVGALGAERAKCRCRVGQPLITEANQGKSITKSTREYT